MLIANLGRICTSVEMTATDGKKTKDTRETVLSVLQDRQFSHADRRFDADMEAKV